MFSSFAHWRFPTRLPKSGVPLGLLTFLLKGDCFFKAVYKRYNSSGYLLLHCKAHGKLGACTSNAAEQKRIPFRITASSATQISSGPGLNLLIALSMLYSLSLGFPQCLTGTLHAIVPQRCLSCSFIIQAKDFLFIYQALIIKCSYIHMIPLERQAVTTCSKNKETRNSSSCLHCKLL